MRLAPLLYLLLLAAPASGQTVTAPVDVGVGPTALLFFGPIFQDQPLHTGLELSVAAVLDREWLRRNQRLVPARYRGMVRNTDEVRLTPGIISLLVPRTLIISPKVRNTSLYGATWQPLGLGLPLSRSPTRLSLNAGLVLTYAFLSSDTLPTTHLLRPGASVGVDLELAASRTFLISLGWQSTFYVPQALGSLDLAPIAQAALFHQGQAYLQLHFRFPYTTRL